MKRHLQLLMLLAAFLVPWATNAQTTVTIGTGDATSRYVPINNYYNYSITEMLYTAEEIGTAGTISSISFYYNGDAKDFPITVYMQNVDASDLSTGISLATADQVFAGTYSVTATEGWHTITLDSPFAYDGTSNLLIGINKGYLYYYSTYPWHCTSTSSTMARYSGDDNNGYTTSTVPGSTSSVRPNIQIAITPGAGPSCQRPESLTVTSITTNTAYLNWTGGSGAFNVEYKLASADTWTRAASNIGWNYMLVNLTPATTYDVRVQSVCSDTVSAWRTATFTTACGAITSFPWSENFESYSAGDFSAPCWVNQHITGSGTNVFKISTSSLGVNSTHQLQLPDMNIGTQTMLRLPEMTFSGNYQFVLDINRSSSTYSTSYAEEGIRVFASADGTLENATEITFIPRNYDVSSSLIPAEDETGWYTYTLPIPITTGTCYIILRGESQYCTPTYMDNFVVEQAPSCPAPIMVTVNYTGGTTATVSWNSDATAFNLDVNGTVIPVTTNPYTLTGLSLATTYTLSVQANCGNGDTSTWTNPVSFTTDFCMPADQCNITITMTDAFGDGGGQIQVVDSLTNTVLATYINDSEDDNGGDSATYTLVVCNGRTLNFVFTATDGWPYENGWVITDAHNDTISYHEGCTSQSDCETPTNGVIATYTVNCAGPCVPMLSEIGDSAATTSSYMYPVNNNYRYSLSETIIDASEIGGPMDINSISYYYTGATASTAKTNCTIYVQPTTKTVFSSISDLELLDPENAVMVYTGSLNCSQGWNTFTFTTPFNYDGVGNLMVIIDDNSNGWDGSNCPFRITSCTGHKTLYWYSDTQNPDPTSSSYSGSKNNAQYRVVMKLDGCQGTAASCMVPTALAVTPGINNATLTWVDSAAAPLYGITLSDASGVVSYATTTTPSYTLTGLTSNSDYTVAVRALCSASDSSRAVTAAFHTECGLMTALPYSYGFEDATTGSSSSADFGADCWKRLNNGTSSYGYPYISSSSSYCHTGSRGLYWNRSTTASYGDYQILALPGVGGSYVMSGLRVKFWAKASSASYRPVFYVGVMTDPTDASTFVYVDTVNVNTDGNTNWAEYTGSLAGYTGTGRYVAIRADRASTTATWTAYFDDVTLQEIPSCVEVSNLVASNITTSSATLTWSDLQNTGATYTVIGPDGVVASGITGTTYTVTGLNASTGYTFNVVANCSATDSSYSTSVTFRTACGLVTMPWSEDFDSWTAKSDCWSYLSGAFNGGAGTPSVYSSAWTLSSSYGNYITLSGKALAMNIWSTYRYWAVTPAISMTSNAAQLTFDIAVSAYSASTPNYDGDDTLAIAITTDSGLTYTPLLVYDNTQLNALSGTYTTVTVPVTGYNGQNVRFAIFAGSTASGGDNRLVIDNVSIDEAPCVPMLSEIGDSAATTTTYNYPVNNYFNYTLSETIIDASEIGGPMDINNISFYYNYATAMTNKSNCTIYVQPTSKTVFSSSSDIELLDPENAVMVYTGDLNCSQGWNTFTFTTPFHYDGVGNLMVIVDDNSGSYNSSGYTFRTSACTGYKTLHWYSDSQNPDPTSSTYSGTKSYTQNRVVMKLDGCQGTAASCMVPTALAVTPGINNATLTWVDSAAAPLYGITLSDASGVVSYATTTTPSYTLTGLTSNSDYTVAVRALCSASDSSRAVAATFHTECDLMTTLPYSYGFEGATTGGSTNPDFAADCWKRLNNGTSNMGYPYISSSSNACHTGTRGLYWYNYSTVSSYGNYRVIVLPGVGGNYNIDDLRLSFWASCTASFRPVFYVGVMTDPTDISTFTVVDTVNVNTAGTTGSWTQYFAPLANYTGTGRYVAIASYPEGSTWTAYVDDVTLEIAPSCLEVSNLAATATHNSATLTWADQNNTNATYTVSDATNVIASGITGTTYTVTGLTANTSYTFNVVANCSATEASSPVSVNVTTTCAPESYPYAENFDSWTAKSACWSFLSGAFNNGAGTPTANTLAWGLYSTYGDYITISGKALAMNVYSTYQYWAVTPAISITGNNAQLTFDVAVAGWSSATPNFDANDTMAVAISTNGGASYTPLLVYDNTQLNALSGTYTTVTVPVTGYNGQNVRFAIFAGSTASGGDNRVVIDNVSIDEAPSCPAPEITIDSVVGRTVWFHWTSTGDSVFLTLVNSEGDQMWGQFTISNGSVGAAGFYLPEQYFPTGYTYLYGLSFCGTSETTSDTSAWGVESFPVSCDAEYQCPVTFVLNDGYGDGWNGGELLIYDSITGMTCANMAANNHGLDDMLTSDTVVYNLCGDRTYQVYIAPGQYTDEISFQILDNNGNVLWSQALGTITSSSDTLGYFHLGTCATEPECVPMVSEIGDSTSTTTISNYPVNNYYNYTLSETIIDASEIGGPMDINNISFYYNYATAMTNKSNCTIYVQPTSKTVFSSSSDIELLDPENAVMVYTGDLNCSQGWNTFTFTTPFHYDGVGNLMVIVDDNSGSYNSSGYTFRTSACTGYKTLHWYSDSQNPDPTSSTYSGTKSYTQNRVVMKLDGCQGTAASCMVPTALAVTPGINNATLTWVDSAAAPLYGITLSDASGVVSYATTTTPSYTLTGLTSNSDYTVAVRALCSASDSSRAATASFHTECDLMATLPYSYGFEGAATGTASNPVFDAECWKRLNNASSASYIGYPYITSSTSYIHTGSRALYWYRSTSTSYGDYQVLVLPGVGGNYVMSGLRVKFWAKASSASYRPVFYVGVMTDPTDASTFVYVDTVNVNTAGNTDWAEYIGNLTGYTGTGRYVAIRADRVGSSSWYAYFDDVTLEEIPACVEVSNLAATATHNSATLTWADQNNTNATYTVSDATNVIASGITGTTYTVTGLTANTSYTFNVVANCSATEASSPVSVNVTTTCAPESYPYAENFDSWTAKSACWSFLSGAFNNGAGTPTANTLAWGLYSTYGDYITISGKALAMNVYSTYQYWAVTPAISITGNNAQLTFDVAVAGWSSATPNFDANDTMAVAISTNGGASYTPLLVYDNTQLNALSGTYTTVTVPVTGYNGQNVRFAIFAGSSASGGDCRLVIDNVSVGDVPACSPVTSVVASNITTSSATLTWVDQINTGATYTVIGPDGVVASNITGTTYTVTGLSASTSYTFHIVANCSATEYSDSTSVTFRTACGIVTMPWSENFDNWTAKSDCWSYLSGAFNGGAGTPSVYSSAWTLSNSYGDYITISGRALAMNIFSTYRYWAVTPAISISSNNAQLTFDIAVAAWSASTPNYDANDTLAIAVTTDSGLTYTPLLVYTNTELNALGNTFTTITVPVTGYNGQDVRFAIFGGSSATGGDNRVVIDNVSVTEAPCWPMGIVIGNEASTTSANGYPVNNYYNYTLTETIIDEAEIGGAMPINGIRYYYNYATAMTGKTNCTIYLQPTTKTTFSSSNDIELLDPVNAVMVYTGSLNCSQGWNEFTFTTPYNYNGTGNLMVIVDDNSGSYNTSSHVFRTSACTGYKSLQWYSDSYNPDPATSTGDTYSGTKTYVQNRVVMALVTCDTATCHAPLAAVASAVGVNNATVTWTSSNATSYSVTLMSGTSVLSYSTTTDTTMAFTGLTANTDYSVVIRGLCSANDSSSAVTADFHTECDLMATLPYTYGFEGAATGSSTNVVFDAECWKRLNNGTTYFGYPYISSSTTYCHSGSRGLYWYNYNTVGTYGNYRVIVLPGLGGNYTMSDLRLKFWAKASSATAQPVFHVGVMTDPTDISTLDTVYTVTTNTAGNTDWAEYSAYLAGYTGTGRYVAIATYPEGATWTAYVDDVTLEEAPSCTEVTNLAVAGVTSSSVTLTWTDALNTTGTTYTVSDAQGTTIASGITGTTYTVTGLTANTSYTFSVVANCSATEASGTMSVTAHTECELMTTLPYSYGFEGAATGTSTNAAFDAECWKRLNNGTTYFGYPYISSNSSYCHTGSRALYWYYGTSASYGDYQVAVLPGVGGTYEMNHLKLKFWAKASSTSYYPVFVIGIMSDPTDISTFTQVATVNVEGTTWTEYEALLASYTGTGRYVAIRSNRGSSAWTAYFDDVTLEEVSGCQPVTNLAATVADNSVTLTWSDPLNNNATYTVIGGNGTIASGLTTTSYTITGLTPNTDYSFSVVANCSADVASDSASIAVHTECTFVATLPYTMGFETADGVTSTGSSTSTTFIDCWHRLNNGTQYFGYPYVSTTSSYIHTGARGLYWANSTTTGTYGDYQCIVLPGLGGNYAMDGLQLKFWARATGTSYHPVLYVGVMTDPTDINSFVYVDTINVEGTTYTEYTSYLNNYTGTGRYVAIRANRPASAWYLTMDDITLDVMPSCFPVTNLTIASTTTSSMTLAWNDNFNDGATYTVSNAQGVIASNVTGTSYTVTGLNAGTEYTFMVTSNCSATDSGETVSVTGYTACATLTAADLPYTEDFEAYGSGSAYSISPCWTKGTNGSTAYPYPTSTAASGTRSLYFYGYKPSSTTGTHVYSYAALPQLDATLDASDLTLSFKARRYSTVSVSYRSIIYVGVMTNPTDASTFVAVDTINMTPLPASTIETYNVILANYTGTGKYVAFYCPWIDTNTSYSYNYIYIDDVMLDITPTCLPVADITASNATTNSVTLSWTDAYNTGATYTVYDMSDSTVMGTGITGTTYTVTGLAASSSYTFGIQANCSATDASPIMTVAARTACGVATMPWVENFDGWTAKSDCWAFLSGAFNGGAGTPTANTSAWTLSNSYGDYITISGKALAMNIYSTNRYWAVTPAISISSNNAQLTFDIAVAAWSASTPNYDANDTLAIAVTTDSGLTYTPLLVYDNTQLNALSNNYTMVTVPLTGYSGQDVRIAFFGGSSASGGDNRVVIDNVSVTEATLDSTVFMLAVNDTTMGTVLPHTGANVYHPGDSVIITAVPNTGYLFDYWVASMDNGDTMHLATNPLRNVVTTGDAGHTYHVTAMFKCDAVAFPFSENFESGVLSNCWTVDGPGTWQVGTGDYTLSTGAHTGTYNAKIVHGTTGNVTKLITPTIDFTGVTAAELRFWHLQRAWSGDQDELRVYYRTSATAAWQQLAAYTNEITAYTEEAIQLPNLSSTYQVAFEFTDGYGYGVALDDITINVPPSCTAVTALTATPTDNSVALTWSDANTSATYTVYNMSDTSVVATGITTTSYTVTGLLANTLYTFGVVANCSATDASQFTSVTVRTNCSAFTAPYTWTFEDMDAGAAPLCWTKVGSGNANVTSSTSYAHNSTKYLRFSGSTSNLIVLPEINGTLSDLQMRLWTRPESTSNSNCGTFSVGYVTDVTDATTFVALETYSYNDFTAYDQKTVRYTGVPAGARMALRHTPNSTSWYWYVDDVTVEEIPSCMPVTDVAVTGVTFNSVSLLWNSVDGAASYIIYDMSDTSVIAATVTDTFYTVTGLTAETNYTFGVKSRCSATDVTPMFATVDAFTGYCQPTPTSVDGQGITSVAFGSLTNDAARPSGAGYRNYSNMSGMVATGSPVTVDITYATGYTYGTIIWVDWNNSMTFESNEVVYVGTSTNANPTTLTCTFNIPADQALGSYRMRILGADSYFDSYTGSIAAAAGANPCASYSWGVAEDYTLTLVTPSVCPNVAGFTVTGVTNNSVSLSWNTVTGATYTLYNDTAVVATGITDTVYTVTGLTANTDYTFGVVANCSATEASAYPATVSARTLCDNANLPFVESFEATSATRNCWTLDAPSTANAITYVTFDGHTAMRFSSYATATDYNQYAYSPVFNTPAEGDSLHVRVRYATYGASDSLWFGFRMANSNDFVWTPTAYMTTGQNDIAYLEATLPINTVQLAIHYYGNYAYYAWIDSVELRVATEVPQVIVYDTTTVTACDSYTWHGTAYTTSGVIVDSTSSNDTVFVLNLTVNYSTTGSATVATCDSLVWNGNTYTQSGIFTATLTAANGCDSVVTLNLTVNYSNTGSENVTACDSYTWHGNVYTASTTAVDTLTNAAGCDSIATLNLTINNSNTGSESITACDSLIWQGNTYTQSGIYTATLTNAAGCDSVVTLNLTIGSSVTASVTETACDSYLWNDSVYTASTTIVANLTTTAGCDSVVTIALTVNYSTSHTDTITTVDSYTWHGNTYLASTVAYDTLTNAAGCDSICILDLTITYSADIEFDTVEACDSYTWHGTTYTASTVVTDTVHSAAGADSIYMLLLTINYSQYVNDTVTACESYTWHGNTYTANTTAVDSLLTVAGCDSICTLTLTINHGATGTDVITGCDSILWNDNWYTTSAIVVDTMETTEGCDSIVAVTLIINQSVTTTETVTICDSYEWNGVTYTVSTVDTAVFAAVNGCDSTVVLNLTVNYSVETIDSVLAIDSYTWHGTVYERSTVAHDTLTAFNGCDSIETLVLTLNYSASTIDTIVTCDSATWHGRTYYASIVDRDTLTSGAGTDSICLLLLTINYSVTDTFTVSARGQYAWHDSIYTQSGTYYYYGVTQEGCNLTEILILDVDTTQDVYYSVAIVVANTEGQLNVGGTVTGAGSYLAGTEVTLTATPDSGYLFDGWYTRSGLGFGGDLITSDSVYTITIDSNVVLVAMFERIGANSALLTVQVDSTMGYVLFNGERAPFNIFRGTLGETVTLEAIGQDDNCEFLGWVNTMGDTISRDAVYDYLLDQTTTTLTAAFVRHEGIDNVDASNVTIFARENGVVVRGAAQAEVYVFDVVGRLVGHVSAASDEEFIRLPQTGVYLVKVADLPARRVVVRQ